MYVKRGLGAESLARIFANLSHRPGDPLASSDADRSRVVRLPERPDPSGKRQVA